MPVSAPLNSRGALIAAGQAGLTPRPKNPLLQKDDVGKARPTCYNLPDDAFSYGRPGNQDLEGAREVSMRWVSHTPSRGPEEYAPDFIHLHKKAAGAKITTSKDLKHFRQEYDFTQTPRQNVSSGAESARGPPKPLVPSDIIPGFTYGRKVRPSTPIHEVISCRFGEKAEREMQRFSERFEAHRQQQQAEVRKIPLTNASRGHASSAKKAAMKVDESSELFKLSKFQRSSPRVDSNIRKPARREPLEDFSHPVYEPPAALGLEDELGAHHIEEHPVSVSGSDSALGGSAIGGTGRAASTSGRGAEDMLLSRLVA